MINVFNVKHYKGRGVYIGRGSIFGNPFHIGVDGNRAQVLALYRSYLWAAVNPADPLNTDNVLYRAVIRLCDKFVKDKEINLICHCAPVPCHGDIIKSCMLWLLGSV